MTDREFDAIRELMAVLRSDIGTVAKVLAAMTERGFTAEEAQFAINEIARRSTSEEAEG